jgi:prepilin-type N-terminal cleavage/methylation domain-containing protein
MLKKAFTLIELLVVIGILAVLMAGVVALIDPVDKNHQANDAVMQSLIANAATAEEAYAAQHNGCYASSWANLFAAGELKMNTPNTPTGYAVPVFTTTAGTCVAPEVGTVVISAIMQSKKYTGSTYWKYETATGKTCHVAAIGTACP